MTAGELMTVYPVTVTPQATIAEALDLMRDLDIRHLPVVERAALVGMLSDRDLAYLNIGAALTDQGAAALRRELATPVVKVMRTDVISVEPETELSDVIGLLLEHKIGAVPGSDPERRLLEREGHQLPNVSGQRALHHGRAYRLLRSRQQPRARLRLRRPPRDARDLAEAGVRVAGAGRNRAEARAPAVIDVPGKGRVIVFGFGSETSGIPPSWAATDTRPGVDLLADLSDKTLDRIREMIRLVKRPRDVVVASIHWGGNWGYAVPEEHVRFAHGLIGAGADVVHGHSSHHVRPIEVFDGKLILYGCGDFLDDYEGIAGKEEFRDDLTLMYFPIVDPFTGRLSDLHLTPMRIRNFKANRASPEEARWLRDTINREARKFDVRVELREDHRLELRAVPNALADPRGSRG